MTYLGLLLELLFLALGIIGYLFAVGKITVKNPAVKESAAQFKKENQSWIRILSLLIIAIMSINIFIHLRDLMS